MVPGPWSPAESRSTSGSSPLPYKSLAIVDPTEDQAEQSTLRPKDTGGKMKRIVTHLSLLGASAILATGCVPVRHNLPPEQRLREPGPGVGGPGPGVLGQSPVAPGGGAIGGAQGMMGPIGMTGPETDDGEESEVQQAGFTTSGPGGHMGKSSNIPPGGGVLPTSAMMPGAVPAVQVTLGQPEGMQVRYDTTGDGTFDSEPLIVPARQNFPQGGIFRLKLTNIANREGVELYPTVELAFANPRTGAYLAHNSVPLQFTEEDFDQVLTGNFVTKVIYLPSSEFQGPALAGIDTLVSTRLDPGIDPIEEADRRGSILAIIRLGDKDIEMAGMEVASTMPPPIAGLPAPFAPAMSPGCGGPGEGAAQPPQLPGMVSGATAPQYGMPMSGTPIGLPGPPHIPLGSPAGLQKHVMRNHTPMHLPQPVDKMKINVRQQPGQSYPNPVSRVRINEQNIHPGVPSGRPHYQRASQPVDPQKH